MVLEFKVTDNNYHTVKEILKAYYQISDRLLTKLKKDNRIFLNNKPVYVTEKEVSMEIDYSMELI